MKGGPIHDTGSVLSHLIHVDVSGGDILIAPRDPGVIINPSTPLPKVLHFLYRLSDIIYHVSDIITASSIYLHKLISKSL